MRGTNRTIVGSFLVGVVACARGPTPDAVEAPERASAAPDTTARSATAGGSTSAPSTPEIQDARSPAPAPDPTPRAEDTPAADELAGRIASYFDDRPGRRAYIQTDKPLYRPGETIWVKTWNLRARDLRGAKKSSGIFYELHDPKGSTIAKKRVREKDGHATNDFQIPEAANGGEYTIEAHSPGGPHAERTVVVASYEAPRIKKELELTRKAYGEGDPVVATIKLARGTGEPLSNHAIRGVVRLDGARLTEVKTKTDGDGGAVVRFELPDDIERGDGVLTVQVEDGGVTESVTRRIPIVLDDLELSFFPEGGHLVEGISSRVYFAAKKPSGKPADVRGRIVDDHGNTVARFSSYKNGLGRVSFTPNTGRRYHAEVSEPSSVDEEYQLPLPKNEGCVLHHYDDFDGQLAETRVGVRCSEPQEVVVSAFLRNNPLDVAQVEVPDGEPAAVYLEPEDDALPRAQGVARVTLFTEDLEPMAERLVYRGRRHRLDVDVEAHRETYGPRDRVVLDVTTKNPQGEPIPAHVAMSVVDDKVLSFANDDEANLLAGLWLEPEIPGELEDPNFYLDLKEEKSARALDLLLGTRGYRKFEWKRVLHPERHRKARFGGGVGGGNGKALMLMRAAGGAAPEQARRRAPNKRARRAADQARPRAARAPPQPPVAPAVREPARGGGPADLARDRMMRRPRPNDRQWAKVREFPVPDYDGEPEGPRNDFRDTVYWDPAVETGENGKARVEFPLSDAITSFRVVSEGVGAGMAGRDETVLESTRPFSIAAKLPLEVSEGDHLELPVTLMNERNEAVDVELDASFGELLSPAEGAELEQTISLEPNARASHYYRVNVTGTRGKSQVRIEADAAGLSDTLERTLKVAPRGFPQEITYSGELDDEVTHRLDLAKARAGSVVASARVYPSPVSTMLASVRGMFRRPHGCFEQASSTNYPNVMLMRYLEEQRIAAPEVAARAKTLLDEGYRKLVGYESPGHGYEWFGGSPAHEALTAYGLLEFIDMKTVSESVDPTMIERTERWLLDRRDGEGGFKQNDKAVDSFGRASEEVTEAYIVYSLTEAGRAGVLDRELEVQAERARSTEDAYVLALAANSFLNAGRERAAEDAVERLVAMQADDGAWRSADHSITRSTGRNLHIETTALATMALLERGSHHGRVRRAVQWLRAQRDGSGMWGATQATVLTLHALTRYAKKTRKMRSDGRIRLVVNDRGIGETNYEAGRKDPVEVAFGKPLARADNTVRLTGHKGQSPPLPYTVTVDYRAEQPATSPDAPLSLETELARETVAMGESVRLTATLENTTEHGIGMTLARIGLPGGLTFQKWQLEELRDEGTIAFYETREREVILYFRDTKPRQSRTLPLELVARIPGTYTAPASRAYPYYADDHVHWTAPLEARVTR